VQEIFRSIAAEIQNVSQVVCRMVLGFDMQQDTVDLRVANARSEEQISFAGRSSFLLPCKSGEASPPLAGLYSLTAAGASRVFFNSLQVANKLVDLLFGVLLGHPVILLDLSNKQQPVPFDDIQVTIRKLAPLGSDLTPVLFPFALHLVPIHNILL
jgi:hypothetical protein